MTLDALFVVIANMLLFSYQDFSGVSHPGPLHFLDGDIRVRRLTNGRMLPCAVCRVVDIPMAGCCTVQ